MALSRHVVYYDETPTAGTNTTNRFVVLKTMMTLSVLDIVTLSGYAQVSRHKSYMDAKRQADSLNGAPVSG